MVGDERETQLPLMYKEGLTRDLLKELKKMGGDTIYFLNDISLKYLSHDKLTFELSLEVMETLKKNDGLQVCGDCQARKVRNEVSDLIYPGDHFLTRRASRKSVLPCMMLSLGARIYFQRIIASVTLDGETSKLCLLVRLVHYYIMR